MVLFVAFGAAYSFSVFFESLSSEFAAQRGSVSLVFSITVLMLFSFGAGGGLIADRYGTKPVVLSGVCIVAAGLMLASQASSLAQVYLFYGFGVGFGVALIYVPAAGVVQRWFVRRRGVATGIAVTGIGLGTFAVPLLADALISAFEWRLAFLQMGIGAAVLGIVGGLALVSDPGAMGLRPDNDPASDAPLTKAAGFSLRAAVGSRPFVTLYCAQVTISLGLAMPLAHLVPYGEDLGLTRATTVLAFSAVGFGSTAGRFPLGAIADRVGRLKGLLLVYVGLLAAHSLWLVTTSAWMLVVFAVLFGVMYGGFVAIIPALIADYFDGPNITGIIGLQYTGAGIGMFLGSLIAGFSFDLFASYKAAIIVAMVGSALACWLAASLPEPSRWREQALSQ
jgi:MFS family permease